MRGRAKKGQFKISRKFDGKGYSIYALKDYRTKRDAEKDADFLRRQGYNARVVKSYDRWLVYQRRR